MLGEAATSPAISGLSHDDVSGPSSQMISPATSPATITSESVSVRASLSSSELSETMQQRAHKQASPSATLMDLLDSDEQDNTEAQLFGATSDPMFAEAYSQQVARSQHRTNVERCSLSAQVSTTSAPFQANVSRADLTTVLQDSHSSESPRASAWGFSVTTAPDSPQLLATQSFSSTNSQEGRLLTDIAIVDDFIPQ
jgi:hypothetical protein